DGVLAPGTVATTDLNGDGRKDLVIPNGGANNVLVYLSAGDGQFSPARAFFAGTNPAGLLVQDLNADGLPDLAAANEVSNDVTILLGSGRGGDWALTPGPRLRLEKDTTGDGTPDVFGVGPSSVTARDVTRDGVSDLVVANGRSDNVFVLPGVGGGFFNDRSPLVLSAG